MDNKNQRAKDLERIAQLRLIDDVFMSMIFDNIECAQLLLRIIFAWEDIIVIKVEVHKEFKTLGERSAWLDVFARDSEGKLYNIEIQRNDKGADPKRARFHSGIIDTNNLDKGKDYSELPDSYVIFITEHDVLGGGLPIYTIERKINQLDNAAFNDGSKIIYVNGEIRDETALGKLMQDFFCTEAKDMHYKPLADRVEYYKKNAKGAETMCSIFEEVRQEGIDMGRLEGINMGIEKGRREGRREGRLEGRQEGRAQERADLLKALRAAGVDEEILKKAAELSAA